ncbi:MAG: DUF58 domain-containing protein [Planctomycetota bacterium]|jgi:uncharacterized protein (DUF58 family)
MIAPTARLLLLAGVSLPGIALVGLSSPAWASLLLPLGLLLALIALIDAALAGSGLQRIEIVAEPVIRLTKGAEGTIDLTVKADSAHPRRVRVGLPLPQHLNCSEEHREVLLPAGKSEAIVSLECVPIQRGRTLLQRCCLGCQSPLGLWLRRVDVPMDTEVRTYPSLISERKRLAAVFLNRGNYGLHLQRQLGHGREFEQLREYVPGDDYGDIHWKASGRRGQPITKTYQIERTQEVYMVIDASRLSARVPQFAGDIGDTVPPTMLERAITATMLMATVTQQQGDLFGAIMFSDRVQHFIRASSGRGHYRLCRDAIYAVEPARHTPDFSEVFSFIRLGLRRRALLVFLTCLDDPIIAEEFSQNIHLLTNTHVVLVNMIQPPGIQPLFSDADVRGPDDVYRHLGGHLQWQRLGNLQKDLSHLGVPFRLLANEHLCPELISQYMNVKHRQVL